MQEGLPLVHLADEGLDVLGGLVTEGGGVEVAIDAAGGAEGDVEVDAGHVDKGAAMMAATGITERRDGIAPYGTGGGQGTGKGQNWGYLITILRPLTM